MVLGKVQGSGGRETKTVKESGENPNDRTMGRTGTNRLEKYNGHSRIRRRHFTRNDANEYKGSRGYRKEPTQAVPKPAIQTGTDG